MLQDGVVGESDHAAQRQNLIDGIFHRLICHLTEDRKYPPIFLSLACARLVPVSRSPQFRNETRPWSSVAVTPPPIDESVLAPKSETEWEAKIGDTYRP
jgi:hypothetical protein